MVFSSGPQLFPWGLLLDSMLGSSVGKTRWCGSSGPSIADLFLFCLVAVAKQLKDTMSLRIENYFYFEEMKNIFKNR